MVCVCSLWNKFSLLKAALRKRRRSHPQPAVRSAGTEFCKSSRQISSPAYKNGPDVQLIASVVSASFFLWFWNGNGDTGSEQCLRQAIAVAWVVKGCGKMSKKQSNLSHMLNNFLSGEVAGRAPQALPSEFCTTGVLWRAGTGSPGLPSLQLPGASLLPVKWREPTCSYLEVVSGHSGPGLESVPLSSSFCCLFYIFHLSHEQRSLQF